MSCIVTMMGTYCLRVQVATQHFRLEKRGSLLESQELQLDWHAINDPRSRTRNADRTLHRFYGKQRHCWTWQESTCGYRFALAPASRGPQEHPGSEGDAVREQGGHWDEGRVRGCAEEAHDADELRRVDRTASESVESCICNTTERPTSGGESSSGSQQEQTLDEVHEPEPKVDSAERGD